MAVTRITYKRQHPDDRDNEYFDRALDLVLETLAPLTLEYPVEELAERILQQVQTHLAVELEAVYKGSEDPEWHGMNDGKKDLSARVHQWKLEGRCGKCQLPFYGRARVHVDGQPVHLGHCPVFVEYACSCGATVHMKDRQAHQQECPGFVPRDLSVDLGGGR